MNSWTCNVRSTDTEHNAELVAVAVVVEMVKVDLLFHSGWSQ